MRHRLTAPTFAPLTGEVLKARWSDLDFERGVWTKPSHHTKQKRTEHIPLSGPALALLADMREKTNPVEENLFPGNATGRPLQDIKKFWKAVTAEAGIGEYRLHDNRHTRFPPGFERPQS